MPTKTTTPAPLPAPPVLPTKWTATTIAGYVSSFVAFLLGLLTSLGVVLPSGVGLDAQAISGAAVIITGAVVGAATTISQHSVEKAALKGGESA